MPPQQPPQRNEILEWYNSIPPITKAIVTLTVALPTLSTFGFIHPSSLIFYWPNIVKKFQLWRLASCFFVNTFNMGFAFNTFFLYNQSTQLEKEVFANQPADYIFFGLVTCGIQLAAASVLDLYKLSDGLLLAIVYLWAQHNSETPVSFMFGLINMKARYLPYGMIATDVIMNGAIPLASIVGLASSYIYYYFTTTYPSQGGLRYLQTPEFLKRWFPSPTGARGFRAGFNNQPQAANTNRNMFGGHQWGRGNRLG